MKDVVAINRNINKRVPKPDMDLIQRVLNFVNVERLESLSQICGIIFEPPHPYTKSEHPPPREWEMVPNLDEWSFDRIGENRRIISKVLRDIANHNKAEIANLHETLREKLAMTFEMKLDLDVERGRITIPSTPALRGMEAHLYYGLSLIFRHDLDGLLRVCKARLDDGAPCDKIFFYRPKLRKFCSKAHKIIGDQQRLTDWWDERRKEQGLPEFKWGSRSRKKSTTRRRRN